MIIDIGDNLREVLIAVIPGIVASITSYQAGKYREKANGAKASATIEK